MNALRRVYLMRHADVRYADARGRPVPVTPYDPVKETLVESTMERLYKTFTR